MGEAQCPQAEQNHYMTETPEKDSANTPLTDDADQAEVDHVSMLMHVPSVEEQQYKRGIALVIPVTFQGTNTDPKMVKATNTNRGS